MPAVYSVADLHGRLDLFEQALVALPEAHFVVLGDVIDRGPRSLALVRRMLELHTAGRVTLLWGNHEQMAASGQRHYEAYRESGDFARYKTAMTRFAWWMDNGGDALRKESGFFGVETYPPELVEYLDRLRFLAFVDEAGNILEEAVPNSVLAVHATPPKAHREYPDPLIAALWLRPYEGPFELPPGVRWSVHGHTPVRAPTRFSDQVYTDLGAVSTGKLCLARLDRPEPDEIVIVQGPGDLRRAEALPSFGTPLKTTTISGARL